jgi:hypothetical protein
LNGAIEASTRLLKILEKTNAPRDQLSPQLSTLAGYCRDAKQ